MVSLNLTKENKTKNINSSISTETLPKISKHKENNENYKYKLKKELLVLDGRNYEPKYTMVDKY